MATDDFIACKKYETPETFERDTTETFETHRTSETIGRNTETNDHLLDNRTKAA